MDDVGFMALAESLIVWVDERYGRLAAWLVGVVTMTIVPAIVLVAGFWWFTR